jgi:CheY-like chemotaxis protein
MPGGSLLVVDDNRTNSTLLQVILRARAHHVRVAQNAEEALAAVAEAPPDLILMDLQLPDVDGLSLTRRLRLSPEGQGMVIIAVTSYAMKGDREKAMDAGCDDFVTKPIDTRQLPLLVARYLASGRPAPR